MCEYQKYMTENIEIHRNHSEAFLPSRIYCINKNDLQSDALNKFNSNEKGLFYILRELYTALYKKISEVIAVKYLNLTVTEFAFESFYEKKDYNIADSKTMKSIIIEYYYNTNKMAIDKNEVSARDNFNSYFKGIESSYKQFLDFSNLPKIEEKNELVITEYKKKLRLLTTAYLNFFSTCKADIKLEYKKTKNDTEIKNNLTTLENTLQ